MKAVPAYYPVIIEGDELTVEHEEEHPVSGELCYSFIETNEIINANNMHRFMYYKKHFGEIKNLESDIHAALKANLPKKEVSKKQLQEI